MRPPHRAVVGEMGEPRVIGPITQTDIVRFAGAGGDFNPLHHDPEFARSAGLPGVISMGQLQAGILAGWLSDWFGVEHLREFEVRFVAAVFISDVLTCGGQVVAIAALAGGLVADVDLVVTRAGDPVVKGSAKVTVSA
jgi:3-hydroxybutyryl-CoA dehydratase